MDVLLGIVFFISLMFLAMIFGERLSLFGITDGQWLTAPFDWATHFWDMVCEAADRIWCFVCDHFWWVAATISGSVGILLIALVMVTGMSDKAEANRRNEETLMGVGSVLDHTAILKPDRVLQINATVDSSDREIDQLVYQVPSNDRWVIPPTLRRRDIATRTPLETPSVPVLDVVPLERGRPPYAREPDYSRSRLNITIEPFLERQGRRVRSPQVDQMIQNSLFALRNGDWRTFSSTKAIRRTGAGGVALREDSQFAVDDLYSRVRVIPGDAIATNDLKVEKFIPTQPTSGEFDIEIRLTNLSRDLLSGLIVRELLPAAWQPVDVQPRGVYRESTVTWLLEEMRPLEERVLKVRVTSSESGPFRSDTEISATAAVAAPVGITSPLPIVPERDRIDRRPIERPQPERPLPPVEDLPDVQLTLLEPPRAVPVNQWVEVLFEIRNLGSAPARGVSLRVDVPLGLSHHALDDNDLNRKIEVRIATLQPKERRKFPLKVKAITSGSHDAIAELTLQDALLDVRPFEVIANDDLPDNSSIVPRPDF